MKNEHKESLSDKIGKKTAPFFEKIGNLTRVQRILVCVVTFVLLSGGYFYFVYMPRQEEMKRLENDLTTLKTRLVTYKQKAAALAKYEELMAEAQARFNLAMKALPDKKEIPSLLTGISSSGNDAGLEFILFQPKAEVQKEFYAEIPVAIKVQGGYHEFAAFFDQVARLYRIVNINDISIKSRSKSGGGGLEASCNAVTYMFVEKKKDVKK
ncbi:MAG: type 4a pilus biogenesis protein PilO [Desulfobacteraceae bacterium]|nr:type 4a pilus biogenesis protein PilO [Desulfobacteraceae bacterium]